MADKRPPAVQVGDRFGRLVAVERYRKAFPSQTIWYWRCACDCGGEAHTSAGRLTQGQAKSCGCLHKEVCADMLRTHGHSGSLTHRRWGAMKSRCIDPGNTAYRHYGAKGVKVCERWAASFEAFLDDMGECPPGMTLDRRENDRGYEPGNCRWATPTQQNNNRTSNRRIEAFGKTQTVAEWARESGMNYAMLMSRIQRGMSPMAALTTPVRQVGARSA